MLFFNETQASGGALFDDKLARGQPLLTEPIAGISEIFEAVGEQPVRAAKNDRNGDALPRRQHTAMLRVMFDDVDQFSNSLLYSHVALLMVQAYLLAYMC